MAGRAAALTLLALASAPRAARGVLSPCAWSFPDAFVRYDLSAVGDAAIAFTDAAGLFTSQLALCAVLPGVSCGAAQKTSSSKALAAYPASCLQSFGVAPAANASLLAEAPTGGLVLTLRGAQCGTSSAGAYYSTVRALCVPGASPPRAVARDEAADGCGVVWQLEGAAFCGIPLTVVLPRPFPVGGVVALALLGALAAYCGGGALVKRHTRGARGLEALPHIETLRAAAAAARRACGRDDAAADYQDLLAAPPSKEEAGII